MIQLKKDDLLKNAPDYEDYSQNVCNLTIEELKAEGLLKCGGCCSKDNTKKDKCSTCNNKMHCKK